MYTRRTLLLCAVCFVAACASKQPKEDEFLLPGQTDLVVVDFRINGVEKFSESDLKQGLKTRETNWRSGWAVRWMPVIGADKYYFNYVHWRQDLARIRTYYAARGHFEAAIVSERISEDPEKGVVRLSITVSEGAAVEISKIEVEGLGAVEIPPTRLLAALPLQEGDVFEESEYLRAKKSLQRELERAGYAYAQVESRAVVRPRKGEAEIYFHVDPGPISHFGEVVIEGNEVIEEKAIREAVTFSPGERFTPDALQDTQERVYDLGVFAVVKVTARTSDRGERGAERSDDVVTSGGGLSGLLDEAQATATKRVQLDPKVPVVIRVNEAKMANVRVGAGAASEVARQEAHGRVDWSSRNFFGGLRKLEHFNKAGYAWAPGLFSSRDLRNEGVIVDSELRFTQPQFIERFTKFETRLRFEKQVEAGFSLINPTAKFGVRRRFFRRLNVDVSYNILLFLLSDLNDALRDPTLRLQPEYILEYFQQRVAYDWRNDALNPTRGFLAEVQLQEATSYIGRLPGVPTGGHFDFLSPSFGLEFYVPYNVWVPQVLALRGRVATIYNLGEKQPPIPQRLYAGGSDSMRSFGRRRLSLYSLEGEAIPIGGLTKVEGSIEPRFRIVRQMFEVGDLWAAPFLDAATILPGPLGFTSDSDGPDAATFGDVSATLLYGAGVGAWWLTPIGPVRLDFAYTLSDITSDPRFRRCAVETDSPAECPGDFVPLSEDPIQERISRWNLIIGIGHSF